MRKAIRIGFLTPYSSIYPAMVPSLVSGFYSAIPEKYHKIFEVIPEYIEQGGEKKTIEAANKLLFFDQVDILSGFVSYKILPQLIGSIENLHKLGFFFDLGEYIPYTQHMSNRVFNNSFQMWQAEFALGHWANKTFGDKGCIVTPIYDGGYHLHSAFRQGAISAGAKEIDFEILNYEPNQSQVKGRVLELLKNLQEKCPTYIHALFCGTEALEFYDEYHRSGLSDKIPLIVSSHMAADEILKQINNLSLPVYSASMWNFNSKEKQNLEFIKKVQAYAGQKPDLHTVLGYETGLLFEKLIPEFLKRDWDEIARRFKTETISGPRGLRSFYLNSDYATPVIDIEKINCTAKSINKIVIEQGTAMQYHHETYQRIHRENVSGWLNPYLCV